MKVLLIFAIAALVFATEFDDNFDVSIGDNFLLNCSNHMSSLL